jgi:DNA-binding HxlR family transcriptional regulator
MDRKRFAAMHCSIGRTAGVVGDPWTLLVLRDLFLGVNRYEELRRDLGIASNVLAERLDRLVADGLAQRHRYETHPPRDEYVLTEKGRDLFAVALTVMAWGDRHEAPEGPPMLLVHTGCGQPTTPVVTCAGCGGELHLDTVTARPGPGGRDAPGTSVVARRLMAEAAGDPVRRHSSDTA